MTQGLVIKNADGSVKLDTDSNITRTIGQITLQGDGEITSAGIGYPNNKLWYIILGNVSPVYKPSNDKYPILRIDDTGYRIFWKNQLGTKIRYGII
nr:MAG TPA: hypothetical protein [Caudoviricetes sp.]